MISELSRAAANTVAGTVFRLRGPARGGPGERQVVQLRDAEHREEVGPGVVRRPEVRVVGRDLCAGNAQGKQQALASMRGSRKRLATVSVY